MTARQVTTTDLLLSMGGVSRLTYFPAMPSLMPESFFFDNITVLGNYRVPMTRLNEKLK